MKSAECEASPDGKHAIDLDTVYAQVDEDSGMVYLDVNCKYCGADGCLGSLDLGSEVDW